MPARQAIAVAFVLSLPTAWATERFSAQGVVAGQVVATTVDSAQAQALVPRASGAPAAAGRAPDRQPRRHPSLGTDRPARAVRLCPPRPARPQRRPGADRRHPRPWRRHHRRDRPQRPFRRRRDRPVRTAALAMPVLEDVLDEKAVCAGGCRERSGAPRSRSHHHRRGSARPPPAVPARPAPDRAKPCPCRRSRRRRYR